MKCVYISGPITGHPWDGVVKLFELAAAEIAKHDLIPMNPIELNIDEKDYTVALARDIEMLAGCQAVLLLPRHNESKGCAAEKAFAEACGIKIIDTERCANWHDELKKL